MYCFSVVDCIATFMVLHMASLMHLKSLSKFVNSLPSIQIEISILHCVVKSCIHAGLI